MESSNFSFCPNYKIYNQQSMKLLVSYYAIKEVMRCAFPIIYRLCEWNRWLASTLYLVDEHVLW